MKHDNDIFAVPTTIAVFKISAFREYTKTFVQRRPGYGVKQPGGTWKYKSKPLSDIPVHAHLDKKYTVGTLGQWYPNFSLLDIDDYPPEVAEDIRANLGLSDGNSMQISSESPDSYHTIFTPTFNGEPPPLRCPFARSN